MAEMRTLWIGLVLVMLGGMVSAADVPETVSPGAVGRVARVADACPSFSWGGVPGVRIWELVVYELGGTADGGRLAATVRIPGTALSWTPSLDQCLGPGKRYAWFVRAVGEVSGDWSVGRLFEIAVGPTLTEVEEALRVLERFVGARPPESSVDDAVAGESAGASDENMDEGTVGVEDPPALVSGVEIGQSSITINDAEVVTTATDQDTLGGLTCAEGQLPKWHSGSSTWVCGAYSAGNQLYLDIDTFHVEDGDGSGLDADLFDGIESSDFAQLGLVSAFTANPVSSSVGGGPLYVNPASGVKEDNTLLGVAVAGAQRFRVDIEGDVELAGSINDGLTILPDVVSGLGFASPNVLAGHSSNQAAAGVAGAGIGGGGARRVSDGTLYGNVVTDDFGSIGGGLGNRAGDAAGTTSDKRHAVVGGGNSNVAGGLASVVGGGVGNDGSGDFSSVGGGSSNEAPGEYAAIAGGLSNRAGANGATIGGGESNDVADRWGTIAGGAYNVAGDGAGTVSDEEFATVGGGFGNEARAGHATIAGGDDNLVSDRFGAVGGGSENRAGDGVGTTDDRVGATVAGGTQNVASGAGSAIGGGGGNTTSGHLATIAGGGTNTAEALGSTVGGGQFNRAAREAASVGGGDSNEALGDYGTVGGGYLNRAGSLGGGEVFATVAGGRQNTAEGEYAVVGGGRGNNVTDDYGTVAGGRDNQAGDAVGSTTDKQMATVSGGENNFAGGWASAVGGGLSNVALGDSAVVAGGWGNKVYAAGSTIAGGDQNTVHDVGGSIGGGSENYAGNPSAGTEDDPFATVAGGNLNQALASKTAIGGGSRNTALSLLATIAGGESNSVEAEGGFVGGGSANKIWDKHGTVAGGDRNEAGEDDGTDWNNGHATVAGGENNRARGAYSTVVGGYNNAALGSYSTVAGGRNNTAVGTASFAAGDWTIARHDGSFVWNASSTATVAESSADDQFVIRAAGGLRFEDPSGLEAAASFVKGLGGAGSGAVLEVVNRTDFGEVGWFRQTDASNLQPVMKLVLPSEIPSNQLRNFLECDIQGTTATRKCHIDKDGTFHAGSDFAEALPARGNREEYEPGDVLLMAVDGSGVEMGAVPYSPRIAGVYSTRPGVLGADKDGETRVDAADVPVAIVGIVPTKVSGENGTIAVGDLLVSSGTAGHAMKGTDRPRMQGAVVGKALEPFAGEQGVIRVLVSML